MATRTFTVGEMVYIARGKQAPLGSSGIVAATQNTSRKQTLFVVTLAAGRLKIDAKDLELSTGNTLKSVYEKLLAAEVEHDPKFDCPQGCPFDPLKPCRHVQEAQARVMAFEF